MTANTQADVTKRCSTRSRRGFLVGIGTGIVVSIAGCTGSEGEVMSMSTSRDSSETVDLEQGQTYEFELSLVEGDITDAVVRGQTIEQEIPLELEEEGETVSEQFEAEETGEYWVGVTVVPAGGRAEVVLREA